LEEINPLLTKKKLKLGPIKLDSNSMMQIIRDVNYILD
jgi:hypothetical protein